MAAAAGTAGTAGTEGGRGTRRGAGGAWSSSPLPHLLLFLLLLLSHSVGSCMGVATEHYGEIDLLPAPQSHEHMEPETDPPSLPSVSLLLHPKPLVAVADEARPMDEEPLLVLPAASRAVQWVISQRKPDWGWGSDTAHTVLALRLANATWFAPDQLESQLAVKQLELELVLRLWKKGKGHHDLPVTQGHLAVNVMALVALCRDPRAFYSKDLVSMLGHQEGQVDFEVAYAQLATCTAGHHVRKARVRRLVDMITAHQKIHSLDTLSVVIMALRCVQHQRRHDLRRYLDTARRALLRQQRHDGSFSGNLHTTALALQAMLASQLAGSWNATRAQQFVLSHQRPDGSFGSLFDTIAVLPLLGGRTLLDVALRRCPRVEGDTVDPQDGQVDAYDMPEDTPPVPSDLPPQPELTNTTQDPQIQVTYIIWKGNNATLNYNLTLTVPVNTTFLEVMKQAAELDHRFVFSASHWGNGLYIHTLAGAKEQKLGYWYWLLYRLPEPPVPGTKPDNKYVVGTGVQETIIKDGDLMLFWYHQI
ncbi:uncharacterized protein CG3556-like isoform X2 [Eriocheir sinensis]|uniref:uncharacterized protein CG3556-like isoform X2 n=1 Tax=Eriocheir sinensis TaxID=95602 RepID=UPI0021C72829|nr:uncharacterized protein CG3556-like isoform X2 [Eriocheir sinensis]